MVATAIDDNAADEKSDKSKWQVFIIRCTGHLCWVLGIKVSALGLCVG